MDSFKVTRLETELICAQASLNPGQVFEDPDSSASGSPSIPQAPPPLPAEAEMCSLTSLTSLSGASS